MARTNLTSTALWSISVLCLVLGAGVVLAFGSLAQQADTLRKEVVRLKGEKAFLESSQAITNTALADLQMMLQMPVETPTATCEKVADLRRILFDPRTPGRGELPSQVFTLLENTCSDRRGGLASSEHAATRAFVDAYIDAVAARLSGQTRESQVLYQKALDGPDADKVDMLWRIRALEGVAYGQLKSGQLDLAAQSLDRLDRLRESENARLQTDHLFVFADLDRIKLLCRRSAPASEVQEALSAVRAKYDAYAASRSDPEHARYARLDRGYIEQDSELYLFCAYAKVKPLTLPAQQV